MQFRFTSGPSYVLFVLCALALVFFKDLDPKTALEVLLGALVWYTGRRAYKEVKLANISMTGGCSDEPEKQP